jgi:hypothetical protein
VIPVKQTKVGGPDIPPEERGDCFAACIASVLEVPLADVPILIDDDWWENTIAVVARHGHVVFEAYRHSLQPKGSDPLTAEEIGTWIGDAYWIASVPSLNLGSYDDGRPVKHVVVMRGAELVHDPGLRKLYELGRIDVPVLDAILLLPKAAP